MPELPPESTLRYLRALSLEAFCDAVGWKLHRDYGYAEVPIKDWTPLRLWKFCKFYDLPVNWETEDRYLGPKRTREIKEPWGGPWADDLYQLYLDPNKVNNA